MSAAYRTSIAGVQVIHADEMYPFGAPAVWNGNFVLRFAGNNWNAPIFPGVLLVELFQPGADTWLIELVGTGAGGAYEYIGEWDGTGSITLDLVQANDDSTWWSGWPATLVLRGDEYVFHVHLFDDVDQDGEQADPDSEIDLAGITVHMIGYPGYLGTAFEGLGEPLGTAVTDEDGIATFTLTNHDVTSVEFRLTFDNGQAQFDDSGNYQNAVVGVPARQNTPVNTGNQVATTVEYPLVFIVPGSDTEPPPLPFPLPSLQQLPFLLPGPITWPIFVDSSTGVVFAVEPDGTKDYLITVSAEDLPLQFVPPPVAQPAPPRQTPPASPDAAPEAPSSVAPTGSDAGGATGGSLAAVRAPNMIAQ